MTVINILAEVLQHNCSSTIIYLRAPPISFQNKYLFRNILSKQTLQKIFSYLETLYLTCPIIFYLKHFSQSFIRSDIARTSSFPVFVGGSRVSVTNIGGTGSCFILLRLLRPTTGRFTLFTHRTLFTYTYIR